MLTKGLLKVSYLKKKLAAEFLNYKSGDFIETISKYQEKFNASRGSVQIAIKELQVEKVIFLQSKGASGTQIVKLDYEKLLQILDINTILGAMSLPYALRYEGLASSFAEAFKKAPFRFAWSFKRGSLNRINGLMNDYYDFLVLSQMAAKYYQSIYDFKIALELEDNSYSSEYALIIQKGKKEIKDGMKIGIDKSSFDQFYLTNYIIKDKKVELVDIYLPNVIGEFTNGNIDAVLWNMDMINQFKTKDMDVLKLDLPEGYNKAVIITKKERGDVSKIIKDYIKPAKIQEFQNKVMSGEISPSF